MSMSALVRALGAAAGGVSKGMDDAEAAADRKRKREQDEQDRAYTMSERARTTADRDRADKLRTDMGSASLPTTVDTAPVAMPIGSRDEPRAPEDMGIRAAGQTFTDPAAATKAAADYNTQGAMALRQSQVAGAAGDPHLAQQLRTGAMQEQAAKYTLNAAERTELDARFNADLQSSVTSWDSLDTFLSDSAADGQGGKMKLKSVPTPDGKSRVVNVVLPDGTLKPTEKVLPNSADGLAMATAELARMPAEKKLLHLHQKEQDRRAAAAQASTESHQAGMLGVAQATQAELAAHHRATESNQARMARAAEAKATAPAAGMTMADLKDGHKGIASTLNADWKTQIEGETNPAKLKAIKVAREDEISTVQRLYTGAMSAGFALTPEQAIVAFRSGEMRTGTVDAPGGVKMKVQGVVYGGRFIPLAENPGAMPPQDAAPGMPGAKPATKPAVAGQGTAAPAVAAPPQAPARKTPSQIAYERGGGAKADAAEAANDAANQQRAGVEAKAGADPEIRKLDMQRAMAARDGDVLEARRVGAQIAALRQQRYGI